jgi:hypothetical protein
MNSPTKQKHQEGIKKETTNDQMRFSCGKQKREKNKSSINDAQQGTARLKRRGKPSSSSSSSSSSETLDYSESELDDTGENDFVAVK